MKKLTVMFLVLICAFGLIGCNNSKTNDNSNAEIAELKEKYPEFFDISTDGGLTVLIWQMAEDSYSCSLFNSGLFDAADIDFSFEVGATIAEMRTILTTYDIDKKDISIEPITNPLSSYLYEINDEYYEELKELFWKDQP